MDRLTILLLGKSRKCFLETETFKTIQIFFQNFSTWKNIGGEGERGEETRDVDAKFYQFRWFLIPGDFYDIDSPSSFFFFFTSSIFHFAPLPSLLPLASFHLDAAARMAVEI